MAQNIGILITEEKQKKLAPAQPVELWEPAEGEVRIRVEAAAQNPVDWKQVDFNFAIPSFPFINGVDVAGVVDKVGEGVTKFKAGDRVASMTTFATHPKHGIYQTYCVMREDSTIPIPPSYTFDEAATVPLAYWTAALGLYDSPGFQLPLPLDSSDKVIPTVQGEPFLVWGGSSSVGALAVQLAVIQGFKVVSTCSPRNFEYVKSLGAVEVLDYHDANVVDKIKALAPGLRYVYDAISEHGSCEASLACLDHPTPELMTVLTFTGSVPESVKTHRVFAGGIFVPAQDEVRVRLTHLWDVLMREGKIKPNPIRNMPDGLASIDDGFDLMRQGKVSGQKLVYHPWETKI
ncbi:GroES-like protein [Calocera cornea HHB12733]|uniref:GroES-like protein n=1 Tax=Calocera cornea HHB12733 TaxID=1353952 RepID=A0A165I326_9BASI|nr:GroES-like protein [Calocera cornea HHB12733]